jgi:hypothetical protein
MRSAVLALCFAACIGGFQAELVQTPTDSSINTTAIPPVEQHQLPDRRRADPSTDMLFDFFSNYIQGRVYEGIWSSMNFNLLSETEGFTRLSLEVIPNDRSVSIRINIALFDGFWTDDVSVSLVAHDGEIHETRKSVIKVDGLTISEGRECDAHGEFEFFLGSPVTLEGYLTSMVCNFSISVQAGEATSTTPHETRSFSAYFVIAVVLAGIELFGLVQLRKASPCLLSIMMVGTIVGTHAFLLIWHITLSEVHNTLLVYIIALANCAVLYISSSTLASMFDEKRDKYNAYAFALGSIYMLGLLLFVFGLTELLVVAGSALFFPQIVNNFRNSRKPELNISAIVSLAVTRMVAFLYIAGCPHNFLGRRPKLWLAGLATSLLFVQTMMMLTLKLNPTLLARRYASVSITEVVTT